MSGENEEIVGQDGEVLCIVCFKNVEFYSVGVCDHPVCYECSTRMRVLCNQNECPICRGQMPKVIFTKKVEPFSVLFPRYERTTLQDRKFGLIFTTSEIQKAYYKLLEYRCNICSKSESNNPKRKYIYYTFQQLKDHMRREHGLSYCSLCVDNLKIFCFERRCYTQQELGVHRRKGDPDDKSHRGHPLCEFCDTRFMDSDELFRHLRREHLFCHFCDADGKHQYYPSMEHLRKHFQEDHYLCEEGDCKSMPLTAVFRTEIDFKAHVATEHGRHLSKSANKQARTLELEFTLAPRPRPDRSKRPPISRPDRIEDEGAIGYDIEPGGPGGGPEPSLNPQNFPALGGSSTVTVQSRPATTVNFTSKMNPFCSGDFPSLGGSRSSAVTITTNSSTSARRKAPEVTITRTIRGGNGSQQNLMKNAENFPCLGPPSSGTSTVRLSVNNGQISMPKVSIHVNHKSDGGFTTTTITTNASSSTSSSSTGAASANNGFNVNQKPAEAFPALGRTALPIQAQWVHQKPKKQREENRQSKVAPAPQLPPSDLSQFPQLNKSSAVAQQQKKDESNNKKSSSSSSNVKKSSSVTVPVSGNWVEGKSSSSLTTNNNKSDSGNNNNNNNKSKKQKNKNKSNNAAASGDNYPPLSYNNNEISSSSSRSNSSALDGPQKREMNGIVKKRSELKIGSLSLSDGNETKPPPGFPVKPPPGLGGPNFPSLGGNDLTFTNSSGQSYSITPVDYHQPTNFSLRNQNLFKKFTNVVDKDALVEFKSYSALFREGKLSPKSYYEHCKSVLRSNFDEIFPELLVLLPNIEKQQELLNMCEGPAKSRLITCENCKQVIFKRELGEHYSYHSLESQFPSLSKTAESTNAWRK